MITKLPTPDVFEHVKKRHPDVIYDDVAEMYHKMKLDIPKGIEIYVDLAEQGNDKTVETTFDPDGKIIKVKEIK